MGTVLLAYLVGRHDSVYRIIRVRDSPSQYPAFSYDLTFPRAPLEIVSISVSLQQSTTSTQPNMSFTRIVRSPIAEWIVFARSSAQYQDYILNVYSHLMPNSQLAYGIMLWNYKGGSIRYCEVRAIPHAAAPVTEEASTRSRPSDHSALKFEKIFFLLSRI